MGLLRVRLTRSLRLESPGLLSYVINCSVAPSDLPDSQDLEWFLRLLAEIYVLWGVEVLAYCRMGSHDHLCFHTPEGNLGRVMLHLNTVYLNGLIMRTGSSIVSWALAFLAGVFVL